MTTSRERRYVYPVTGIDRFTDGDTYWFRLDYGFRQTYLAEIRLLGYDTPERYRGSEFERAEAIRAAAVATAWLSQAFRSGSLWVRTEPDPDKYGRWLGEIWSESPEAAAPVIWLGEVLRGERLASVWPTRWHQEFDHTLTTVAKPVYTEGAGRATPAEQEHTS